MNDTGFYVRPSPFGTESLIRKRAPRLHASFFLRLSKCGLQVRFSSIVTPRNLTEETCFITVPIR